MKYTIVHCYINTYLRLLRFDNFLSNYLNPHSLYYLNYD